MNYKILMVDDDRELLKMLNQYFTLKNYTVIIAENGIEAMEKISVNPDIILLDVNMPGMDGIEVCRRIRDMVSCPDRKSTRLNSSHNNQSRMPSSA